METKVRLRLIYPEEKIKEPILNQICKKFDVEINIRKADVDEKYGRLELELKGKEEEIKNAIDYLKEKGIEVAFIDGEAFRE
jgi:ABC-type methionine transport system ATPase subunit